MKLRGKTGFLAQNQGFFASVIAALTIFRPVLYRLIKNGLYPPLLLSGWDRNEKLKVKSWIPALRTGRRQVLRE
jgi:hypothetical protein